MTVIRPSVIARKAIFLDGCTLTFTCSCSTAEGHRRLPAAVIQDMQPGDVGSGAQQPTVRQRCHWQPRRQQLL